MRTELSKIILNGLGIIFSIIIIWMANTGRYFGKFLNYSIKCKDNPESSFPCYGIYDVWVMIIFSVISIYFLIRILYLVCNIHNKD